MIRWNNLGARLAGNLSHEIAPSTGGRRDDSLNQSQIEFENGTRLKLRSNLSRGANIASKNQRSRNWPIKSMTSREVDVPRTIFPSKDLSPESQFHTVDTGGRLS